MAWSFRKRIKIAPGVNIHLSKSGVSTSVGPKGAKVNVGPKGTSVYTSIPGTGLYYRGKVSEGTSPSSSKSNKTAGNNTGRKIASFETNDASSDAKRMADSMYHHMETKESINDARQNTKHNKSTSFLSDWTYPRGNGSVFYGCLGSWPRFLIWVGILLLLFFIYDGIKNASLEWWQFTLYSSLVIGALLFLWRINGGTLSFSKERSRFYLITCISFAVVLWLTIVKRAYSALLIGGLVTLSIILVVIILSNQSIRDRLFSRSQQIEDESINESIPESIIETKPTKTLHANSRKSRLSPEMNEIVKSVVEEPSSIDDKLDSK